MPREISVSMPALAWRAPAGGPVEGPGAQSPRGGQGSDTHCQPSNWRAGTMAMATTGTGSQRRRR